MGGKVIRKRDRRKAGRDNKRERESRERRKMSPESDSNAEERLTATYNPLSGTDAICHPSLFRRDGRNW